MTWTFKGVSGAADVASGDLTLTLPGWANDQLNGVAYDDTNDVYVAAGGLGVVLRSTDGTAWEHVTSPTANYIYAVIRAASPESKFVMTAASGKVFTSSDGTSWTTTTSGLAYDLEALAYSPSLDLFVGVGSSGKIYTSPDATTWTLRTSGTTNYLHAVAYSSSLGLFVAAGNSGTIVTSPDGVTWTVRTSGTSQPFYGACFGDGLFVLVGGTGVIATSPDGSAWTIQTSGVTNYLYGACYGAADDLFVVVGEAGKVLTSPDGATWTLRTAVTTSILYGVAYSSTDDTFVAVGAAGHIRTSADGATWVNRPAAVSGDLLVAAVAYRDTAAFTMPSGWTLVDTQQSSGNVSTTASTAIGSGLMAWIVMGGSAPDLTFLRSGGNVALGRIVSYSGNTSSPYDTGVAATLAANGTAVTASGITTAEAGELLVMMAAGGDNVDASAFVAATEPSTSSGTGSGSLVAPSTAWKERFDSSTSTGADTFLAVADAVKATAGATGDLQYTASVSSRHVVIAAAFKMAAVLNHYEVEVVEAASAADQLAIGYYEEALSESATAADTQVAVPSFYAAVREAIRATSSATLQAAYSQALTETAIGRVVLAAGKHFEALVAEAITGNVGLALALGTQLIERSQAADVPVSLRQLAVDVAEAIVAMASLGVGQTYDFLETASANDLVTPRVTALALILESLTATDTPAAALTLMSVVSEEAEAQDTPTTLAAYLSLITEAVNAGVLLKLGDDYYVGWVLNPEGMPTKNGPAPTVSQYQNYPFNSLARIGSRYYAAGAEGLYELTGSDDAGAPIVGYLKSGKLDFGSAMQKRLDSAYFAVATDGTVRLKVITHDDGENLETWYEVVSRDAGEVAENIRLKIGKGLRSRYWQFELVVEDASHFEMEEMQLIPMMLTRRL